MYSNPERLQYLFQRYLNDVGTPEEIKEFWELFSKISEHDPVKQDLWQLWYKTEEEATEKKKDWGDVLQQIHQEATEWETGQSSRRPLRQRSMWQTVAAAVVIFFIGFGAYFLFFHTPVTKSGQNEAKSSNNISPGGKKAILTLANGKKIILDSAHTGTLAMQGNSNVVKMDSGLLAYNQQNRSNTQPLAVQYNILRTPRGGEYQVVLPDSTKVWLNSASSIRFPTSFTGDKRRVEITGEVYFEVAKDAKKPFIVKNRNIEIKVLGTHFNVNTYKDESATKVTLLKGSVRVVQLTTHHSQLILPGQQLQINEKDNIKLLKDVNVDEVIAWKNNLFWFDDEDIHRIMRQVSRWYNADVIIKGNIPQHFTGSIPRNIMVSGVFEVLKRTGSIHFKVKNKKIIVSP